MDVITIIGVMSRRTVRVKTVTRVLTHVDMARMTRLSMTAELLDKKGNILAYAPVYRLPQEGLGLECSKCDKQDDPDTSVIQAFVPNIAKGARLRLVCDKEEKEMWHVNAPDKEPRVESFQASVKDNGMLKVSCRVSHSVKQPEIWIRWSDDEGKNWHPVQTRLGLEGDSKYDNTFILSLAMVPAGKVLLQLVVNDGFFTTISDPVSIIAPKQPAAVSLLHPQQNQLVAARRSMRLWAIVNDNAGRPAKEVKCVWSLDGKEVAEGTDVWVTAPAAGKHTCLLKVDVDGQKIERKVEFETVMLDARR